MLVRYLATMRIFFLLILMWLAVPNEGAAQRITSSNFKLLQRIDDSLQTYGDRMLDDTFATERLRADSMFTRLLVRAMRVPYSFYFGFDSMQMAPVLYPEDSTFRIITWHIPMNDENYRQRGVIQYNTPDGSIKFTPLFDVSDYSEQPQDSIRNNQNWIGAVYYKLLQNEVNKQKVYTLLGYDENNDRTTRKWIDILRFNEDGQPQFGGDFFFFNNDSIFPRGSKRYVLEYKKEGRARINYDEVDSLIVIDNLVSESNEPEKKYTLVPGGDYEALKWDKGGWQYIDKLFMEARGDGNEPKPMLILKDDGSFDDEALDKQTEKNLKAAEEKEKAKATTPPTKKTTAPKPAAPAKKKPASKTGNG